MTTAELIITAPVALWSSPNDRELVIAHLRGTAYTELGPEPLLASFADERRATYPGLYEECRHVKTREGFEKALCIAGRAGVTIGDMVELLFNCGYLTSSAILRQFGDNCRKAANEEGSTSKPPAKTTCVSLARDKWPHEQAALVDLTRSEFYTALRCSVDLVMGSTPVYLAMVRKYDAYCVESDYPLVDDALRKLSAHPVYLTFARLADDLDALNAVGPADGTLKRVAAKLRSLDKLLLSAHPPSSSPPKPPVAQPVGPKVNVALPPPAELKAVPEAELKATHECVICLEERPARFVRSPCGHTSCGANECMGALSAATCPVCRQPGLVIGLKYV
jgi:hypothetical protein